MTYNFKSILYYSTLIIVSMIFVGCECKDTICFNDGRCVSGTCQCPEGYNERDYLKDCREVRGYFEHSWESSEEQQCNRFPDNLKLSKTDKTGTYNVTNATVIVDGLNNEKRSFDNGSQLTITGVSSDNSYSFILNLRDEDNNEIFYSGIYNLGDDFLSIFYDTTNFDEWNACDSKPLVRFQKY